MSMVIRANAQTCPEGTYLGAPLTWDDGYSIRELDGFTSFTRQTCEADANDANCMVSRARNDIDSEVQACATICQASSACTGFYVTQSNKYICTTYEGSDKLGSYQTWPGTWRFFPRTNHIVTSTGETVYGLYPNPNQSQCRRNTDYRKEINSARDGLVTCPGDQNSKRSGGVSCQCAVFDNTDGGIMCLVNQDNTKYIDSDTGEITSCPDVITPQELINLQIGATLNTPHNIADEAIATNYDGTIVAIGMPQAHTGRVVVYRYHDSTAWQKIGDVSDLTDLRSDGIQSQHWTRFGSSISLSDDGMTLAIGAPDTQEYIHGNPSAYGIARGGYSSWRMGRIYLYKYNGNNYNRLHDDFEYFEGIKKWWGDNRKIEFGYRVELSGDGNSVVVSAKSGHTYGSDGSITTPFTGYVQVYRTWNQIGSFVGFENERIGDDVSISRDGNTFAYSAVQSNYYNGAWTYWGRVRVYRYSNPSGDGQWELLGSDIWGEAPGDKSGGSISLSADGTRIAIGAIYNDGAAANAGHVRVWEYSSNTNTWTQMGSDIDGKAANDYSGRSVSLSADGTRVAIRSNSYVTVYEYSNSGWNQLGFDMLNTGGPMALSGDGYRVATLLPGAKDMRVYAAGGTYVPVGLLQSAHPNMCTNCLAGKISNGPFTTTCINCPAGKSSEVGSNTCTDCPADKISSGDGGVCVCNDGMFDYNNICIPKNTDNTKYIDRDTREIKSCPNRITTQQLVNLQIGTTQQGSYNSYVYSTAASYDGTIVAVGTPEDGNGRVTIYKFQTTSGWLKLGNDIFGEAAGDKFGHSISLSDDGMVIAIGATSAKHNNHVVGHVRVYYYTNSHWIQMGDDIHGNWESYYPNTKPDETPYYPEDFGYSVSLSGDGTTVAASATYGHSESLYYTGYVAVRAWSDQHGWVRKGENIVGTTAWEMSGSSVSLSYDGNTVAIGSGKSYWTGSSWNNTGRVRVFATTNRLYPKWEQVGDDIAGESISDWSGQSVSLSADGTRVAIDGQYNDGAAGTDSGHVRVWEYSNNAWTQMGSDIDGEAAYDYSGGGVSLSADGTRVAIGSQWNDGNGESSGHVRVYEYSNSGWNQLGIDIDGVSADDRSFVVSLSGDGTRVAIGAKNAGYMRVFAVGGSYAPTTAAEVCTTCPAGKLSTDGLTCIDMANQPTCINVFEAYDDACTKCAPVSDPVTICGPGTTWSDVLKQCIS